MNFKHDFKRLIVVFIWVIIGGGLLVLLLAAVRNRSQDVCNGYQITFSQGTGVVVEAQVLKALTQEGKVRLRGRKVNLFELKKMEERLSRNPWIADAELFFDKNANLQIRIIERFPVARIFTTIGSSFYIDSSAKRLPITDIHLDVPVFTGFSAGGNTRLKDSLFLREIILLSGAISKDSFWKAQVAQVDITPERMFVIIPTIGNHFIELGDATDSERKLKNLRLFYQQVIPRKGIAEYAVLKAQFRSQIVAVRKTEDEIEADSIRAALMFEPEIKKQTAMQNNKNSKPTAVQKQRVLHPAGMPGRHSTMPYNEPPMKQTDSIKPKAIMPKTN